MKVNSKKEKKIAINGFDMSIVPVGTYETSDEYWAGDWDVFRKQKKEPPLKVGRFRFLGKPNNGRVEIEIEIDHDYINNGYASATLKAINDWCFARNNIYIIDAHIDEENKPALRAFTKAGYVYRSREHKVEHYSVIKPYTSWLGLYIVIGVWAGLILGVITTYTTIGFIIGLLLGIVCGKIMENKSLQRRDEILGSILGEK